jgi:hypothetical protein
MQVDPSSGGLAQLIDSQKQHDDNPNHFASGSAAILPHEGNGFFTDFQQGIKDFDWKMNEPDALDVFLNHALTDLDEHSSTTSKVHYDSDNGMMPPEFESHGIMQVMI